MGSNPRTPWVGGLIDFILMHYTKQLDAVMANRFNSLYMRKVWNSPREQRTNLHALQAQEGLPGISLHAPESQSYRSRALGHQLIPYWDRSRGSCQGCFSATGARCFGCHKTDPERTWLKVPRWKLSSGWIALPNPVSNHEQPSLDSLLHLTQHSLDNAAALSRIKHTQITAIFYLHIKSHRTVFSMTPL